MVGEIVANALKLLRDQTNRGDIKLIDKSLQGTPLRAEGLRPLPRRAQGQHLRLAPARSRATTDYRQAAGVRQGDGRRGVDGHHRRRRRDHGGRARRRGAEPSFGLAIRLPFEQRTNPFIENDPKLINFKYFFTRKLMFVRSSHAIALFPGGFGTMDEGLRGAHARADRQVRPHADRLRRPPRRRLLAELAGLRREPTARPRPDRPERPGPLQDHRQRRRGRRARSATSTATTTACATPATSWSSACTAGPPTRSWPRSRRSSPTSRSAASSASAAPCRSSATSRRSPTCPAWSSPSTAAITAGCGC